MNTDHDISGTTCTSTSIVQSCAEACRSKFHLGNPTVRSH